MQNGLPITKLPPRRRLRRGKRATPHGQDHNSEQLVIFTKTQQHRQNWYTSIHAIHNESVGKYYCVHTHYTLTFTLAGATFTVPYKNTTMHKKCTACSCKVHVMYTCTQQGSSQYRSRVVLWRHVPQKNI